MDTERALHGARRNPFYLLSALSMLIGCFTLSHHLTPVPGKWMPIVVLIGVLQVYEFLLLALALYLNRRAEARVDAVTLLLLGLLFLVDATHLNAELAASHPGAAPWVAATLLVLAAVKLGFLRSALGLTSRRAFAMAMAGLGLVLFLPVTVRTIHFMEGITLERGMEALVVYALWWLVGAIPMACLWVERERERSRHVAATWVTRTMLLLPFVSLVLHLLSLHWLYQITFHASYATPLLIGLSTYISISVAEKLEGFGLLVGWGTPLLAALLSMNSDESLTIRWDAPFFLPDLVVSPLRLALLGLALSWFLHRFLVGERIFGWAAAGSVLMALSGHSSSSMGRTWAHIIPDSAGEVGLVSILAAFALLALGFAKSLVTVRDSARRTRFPT